MTLAFESDFKQFLEQSLDDSITTQDLDPYLKQLVSAYNETKEPVFELKKCYTKSGRTEIFTYATTNDGRLQTRAELYRSRPLSRLLYYLVNMKYLSDNLTCFIEDFEDLKERGFSWLDYELLWPEVNARGLELVVDSTDNDYLIGVYDGLLDEVIKHEHWVDAEFLQLLKEDR